MAGGLGPGTDSYAILPPMTTEATSNGVYNFRLMNLDLTLFRSEQSNEWMLRVTDADEESAPATVYVEQPLDQAFEVLRTITTMSGLLLQSERERQGTPPPESGLDPV